MFGMMGQIFSTLHNRRSKKGKGGERKGERIGGKRGLPFSLVCTLYSLDSDKLKNDRKSSVYTHMHFVSLMLRWRNLLRR